MLTVHAPVRTADLGGWTDTWFASNGAVCNVAVEPGIFVTVERDGEVAGVRLVGVDGLERLGSPDHPSDWADPVLGAALASAPHGTTVRIASDVPVGSGLGSSAAVCVAMLAAFDAWHGRPLDRASLVRRAHRLELDVGRQSGVQDQAAAVYGGVHLWDVSYPAVTSAGVVDDDEVLGRLRDRLLTVYLGSPHESSALHELVIRELEDLGTDNDPLLASLRSAARRGFGALLDGDFAGYGAALVANHEGQRALNSALISDDADHLVTMAALHGAAGWKVNGAGGTGGSAVLLARDASHARRLREAIEATAGHAGLGAARVLDLVPARSGVRVC